MQNGIKGFFCKSKKIKPVKRFLLILFNEVVRKVKDGTCSGNIFFKTILCFVSDVVFFSETLKFYYLLISKISEKRVKIEIGRELLSSSLLTFFVKGNCFRQRTAFGKYSFCKREVNKML